ncbi:MAG: hypothetical protein KKE62_02440 [Proteobacteria bacterium]|nr:hypothetical protein [Pseudomonadota bacterium]MBU1387396.1 hypothetical protein [Pseudomonadota bacterium]MBU1541681.1 hypothetical protein [Pseudomonadota bacterium]MBU2431268.1 hypothetical protein [Pseudomonadota bacterium]MBU2482015.1 hypothetical protein [Pseudomonadota bacterium]
MSNENTVIKEETLNAFNAMWDLHPSPVLLIRTNRDIVAVNEAGRHLGIPAGIKCFQLAGNSSICDGCKGTAAVKENTGKQAAAWQAKRNMFVDTYWIPVQDETGLFVHFGNDITEYVKEEFIGKH